MILVTGSTGTIGSHVVSELVARGAPVRAVARTPKPVDGAETVAADLADLGSALDGVQRMFLLSPGLPGAVELQSAAIDAARAAGVEHVVKLAAIGYDSPDPSGVRLVAQHTEIVAHLRESGLAWTVLAPNDFFENLRNSAPTIAQGQLYTSLEDARVASVAAHDVGAVAAAILADGSHQGESIDLTGPEALTRDELAAAVSEATGHEVAHVRVSDDQAREGMRGAGVPEWVADGLIELFEIDRAGSAGGLSSGVRDVLGREPQRFADWAREHAGEFRG